MIETPRRMTFDWHGSAGREPVAGDCMRAIPSGRTWLVLAIRPVKVRVSRGETSRHAIQMIEWPDPVPAGARVFRFHWHPRAPRRARRLAQITREAIPR